MMWTNVFTDTRTGREVVSAGAHATRERALVAAGLMKHSHQSHLKLVRQEQGCGPLRKEDVEFIRFQDRAKGWRIWGLTA